MTDRKKSKQSEPELEVEKLEEPETQQVGDAHWKSYQLFFAEGEKAGGLFGVIVCANTVPLDNINGVMLKGCNIKAMNIRATSDVVNKTYVDPS